MSDYYDEVDGPQPNRSIATILLRTLLFAGIAFGVYYILVGNPLGDEDVAATATESAATEPMTIETTTPPPLESMPTDPPTTQPPLGEVPSEAPSEGASETPGGTVGEGVSVQVIAGADTSGDQFDDAVDALVELGYDVTESGISPNSYPQTTVFATPGEEGQAEALTAADDRFTTYDPDFPGLNEQIQLHVLVGEDWPTG